MRDPRNIVRIDLDSRNTHGWQVRMMRRGEMHTKSFSDARFGGSEEAYAAAEAYREQLMDELPEPLSGAEVAVQVCSTSGVPGIRLRSGHGVLCIEADIWTADSGRKVRSFSLRKWGLRKAVWKACRWKAEADPRLASSQATIQTMYETAYRTISKQIEGGA